MFGHQVACVLADRGIGMAVYFTAFDNGHLFIKQGGQGTQNTCLGLPSQPQQDKIMSGKDGINQFRNNGSVISDDTGKNGLTGRQFPNQILSQLVLYGTLFITRRT